MEKQWHSYPQEKPSHSCICAVVLDKSYDIIIDTYLYKECLSKLNSVCTGFEIYEKYIVAWMELPKYEHNKNKEESNG